MATKNRNQQTADRSITLDEAWERFSRQWKSDGSKSDGSIATYGYGMEHFREWMGVNGYELADLDGWTVGEFSPWLSENNDFTQSTLESYTSGVGQFLKFCEENALVADGTADGHETFRATGEERQWDQEISVDRAEKIVDWMKEHFPSHRDTVVLTVLLRTGMRKSGLRSIDLSDLQVRADGGPVIDLQEREGTTLKGRDGKHERLINIKQETYELVQRYVKHQRETVCDKCDGGDIANCDGRHPLITTRFGRMSKSVITDTSYKWTCPQHTSVGDCSCNGKPNVKQASKCEMSRSPHALRAAHVTYLRDEGWPFEEIGGRVGAEPDTLKSHYDRADKEQESKRRRSLLDDL